MLLTNPTFIYMATNPLINQPHLYLYGHQSLNDSENKKIILSTIKFIKDTQRFTN